MRDLQGKKRVAVFLAVVLTITVLSTAFAFAEEAPKTAEEKIQLLVSEYGADSVQYAVIDNGKIIKSGQAGNYSRTEDTALSADTMYGIGSISKVFTAAAVMKLAEQGKLSLDAPVTNYLPNFKMADERYKKITVRMLLNHSSGILGSTFKDTFLLGEVNTYAHDNLLANLADQRLKAEPGAFSVYCNDGYTLAELVVEQVSGMSFTEFLHVNFTEPLGIENTKTPMDNFDRARLAKTYYPGIAEPLEDAVNVIGTGGIYSTAEDLCRFAQIFMEEQGTADGILSVKTAQMTGEKEYERGIWPDGDDDQLGYGLGWDNVEAGMLSGYGIKALNKGGDTLLFHGTLTVLPRENMAVAILSSGGSSIFNQMAGDVLLMEVLDGKGRLPQNSAADAAEPAGVTSASAVALSPEILENAGHYANVGAIMKVSLSENGKMSVTLPGVEQYEEIYYHSGGGIFKDETGLIRVSFAEESNGKVYLKTAGPSIVPGLGQMNSCQYTGQKIEIAPPGGAVLEAWKERNGVRYYVVDETYTSQYYALTPLAFEIALSDELGGYVGVSRIETADKTKAVLEIPGMQGRDLREFSLTEENGVEYFSDGVNKAIHENAVNELYSGTASVCTIPQNGEAVWYKAGRAAGKTMHVTLPAEGAFSVYNSSDVCVNSSYASGRQSVELPEDGMIVFAGEPGQKFEICLKETQPLP